MKIIFDTCSMGLDDSRCFSRYLQAEYSANILANIHTLGTNEVIVDSMTAEGSEKDISRLVKKELRNTNWLRIPDAGKEI